MATGHTDIEAPLLPMRRLDGMGAHQNSAGEAWTPQVGDIVEYTGEGVHNTPALVGAIVRVGGVMPDNSLNGEYLLGGLEALFLPNTVEYSVDTFNVFAHNVRLLVRAEDVER